jgi:lipoprotein-anchoring transpeptidase ErfK/SrfK
MFVMRLSSKLAPQGAFKRAGQLGSAICVSLLMSGVAFTSAAQAGRYADNPPVMLSPGLTQPWMLQLGHQSTRPVVQQRQKVQRASVRAGRPAQATKRSAPQRQGLDPQFLPVTINYQTSHKPGTIIIDTASKHLHLILPGGKARRFGVGVGKAGFEWSGTERITRKATWPSWTPPKQMIAREAAKGRIIPAFMPGGQDNPMGARALYLGSTLYRIHGTNQPWTIGKALSSGCIRMRNQDVTELYERAKVGAKVIVL